MKLIFLLVSLVTTSRAAILFVDLNDAPKEVKACADSAGADQVEVVNSAANGNQPVGRAAIERKISEMERQGHTIDSIVISGHDGNGEFFGGEDEQNHFTHAELRDILAKPAHKRTRSSLKLSMLWGCYGGNVGANENYWLQFSDRVQHTVGFPVQSFTKNVVPSYQTLGQMCDESTRLGIQEADTKEDVCRMYKSFPMLAKIGASLCSRNAIATSMYDDETHHGGCYGIDELYERCGSFDPEQKLLKRYGCYFTGEEGCANPPLDGSDVNAPPGSNELRSMYNATHLWSHCRENLKGDRKYNLPYPATVIRLVKYQQIKDNLNRLNANELDDYDSRLEQLGLSKYQLGDLSEPFSDGTPKTRAWINSQINGAVSTLYKYSQRGVANGDTQATVVYRMAQGLKATLVDLRAKQNFSVDERCTQDDPPRRCFRECSHFSLVHAGIKDPKRKSQCILSYEEAAGTLL